MPDTSPQVSVFFLLTIVYMSPGANSWLRGHYGTLHASNPSLAAAQYIHILPGAVGPDMFPQVPWVLLFVMLKSGLRATGDEQYWFLGL